MTNMIDFDLEVDPGMVVPLTLESGSYTNNNFKISGSR